MYPSRCKVLTSDALLCGSTLLTAEAQSALSARTCRYQSLLSVCTRHTPVVGGLLPCVPCTPRLMCSRSPALPEERFVAVTTLETPMEERHLSRQSIFQLWQGFALRGAGTFGRAWCGRGLGGDP